MWRICLIILLLAGSMAAPFILGATCAPPSQPAIIGIVPEEEVDRVTDTPLAECLDGFICVQLANLTVATVQFDVFVQNGFDPLNLWGDVDSFECCTNPNSPVACPCPCDGADEGECELSRTEIFEDINFEESVTLEDNGDRILRIRCEDIKNTGVAAANTNIRPDPVLEPYDDAIGPVYRGEDVSCGETMQFRAVDLNAIESGSEGIGGSDDPENVNLILQFRSSG
jgi:hypothetical protein